jgi:hypothetical protein
MMLKLKEKIEKQHKFPEENLPRALSEFYKRLWKKKNEE